METTVNIHDAKTHLSRLLAQVAKGKEFVIARAGRPVARLSPLVSHGPRKPGAFLGQLQVPDTFFDPLPAKELKAWEGS
jgi:prevent-host-death family protein